MVQWFNEKLFPLNVSMMLSNVSGYVKHASCDCKASLLRRCAHIAAVLLKLSGTSTAEKNIITPSASKPCIWIRGKNVKRSHKNFTLQSMHQENENPQQSFIIGIQDLKNKEDLVSQMFQTLSLACTVKL